MDCGREKEGEGKWVCCCCCVSDFVVPCGGGERQYY